MISQVFAVQVFWEGLSWFSLRCLGNLFFFNLGSLPLLRVRECASFPFQLPFFRVPRPKLSEILNLPQKLDTSICQLRIGI